MIPGVLVVIDPSMKGFRARGLDEDGKIIFLQISHLVTSTGEKSLVRLECSVAYYNKLKESTSVSNKRA